VERNPDVGVPVDRERLPRLVLERTHERACAGDENDDLRLIAVEEAARHRGVAGIGHLRLDGAGALGQLSKCRRGAGDGDHRGARLDEGRGDPAPQAAARTDHDGGLARQIAHYEKPPLLELSRPSYDGGKFGN
jgi:hypothetical protein